MIEIIRNWRRKRQEHKKAQHEQLLQELSDMVDTRRKELLAEKV